MHNVNLNLQKMFPQSIQTLLGHVLERHPLKPMQTGLEC